MFSEVFFVSSALSVSFEGIPMPVDKKIALKPLVVTISTCMKSKWSAGALCCVLFFLGILTAILAQHESQLVVQSGIVSVAAVLFGGMFVAVFYFFKRTGTDYSWSNINSLILLGALLYIGTICGLVIAGSSEMLWVADSRAVHVPGVTRAIEFLRGNATLELKSIYAGEQVQLVYLWVAIFALPFGLTPVVTSIALLVLKIFTWAYVGRRARESFGLPIAMATLCFLIFVPTQIFYGLVFYKEPLVQLLCAVAVLESYRFYSTGRNLALLLAFAAISCLALERFYLAPMLFLSATLAMSRFFVRSGRSTLLQKTVLIFAAVGAAAIFGFLYSRDFGQIDFFPRLARFRADMMAPSDISGAWNLDLWYPFAVLKILFTPFFTFQKFEIFKDLSALLTWGSFASQLVILLGCFGFWFHFRKKDSRIEALILSLPLVAFVLLFGYLAPYSGRQRDSFFPIIALFAAIAIERWSSLRRHKAS